MILRDFRTWPTNYTVMNELLIEWIEFCSQCEHVAVLILTVSKFRKSEIKKNNNSINDSMIRTVWNKAAIETVDKKMMHFGMGSQGRGENTGVIWGHRE